MDIDKETAEKLLAIVKELCSINDYEFPYRVPELRAKAERELVLLDFKLPWLDDTDVQT